MADGIEIDVSEVVALAAAFAAAPAKVSKDIRGVLQKGALNIKNDLNSQAAASTHFKGMAGSVTYDTRELQRGIEAEIGPDKGRRGGPLGNLFFFGGANGGGGTGDLDAPLRAEEPRFMKALGDVGEKALGL